jgi:hypothetical protein
VLGGSNPQERKLIRRPERSEPPGRGILPKNTAVQMLPLNSLNHMFHRVTFIVEVGIRIIIM